MQIRTACLYFAALSLHLTVSSTGLADTELGELETMSLEELLNVNLVVTSASKIEQTVAEAPSIISVVTRQDIQSHNYRSVSEALNSIPGLFINTDYVFDDVGVRGISGEMRGASRLIKVMINGQATSFRIDTTNFIGPEMIPIDAVERIEVIRGPASALYGANAFLGVVNVITRTGKEISQNEISLKSSFFNTNAGYDLGFLTGKQFDSVDVLFAMQKNTTDRSGLALPCGSTQPAVADPCSNHRSKVNDPSIFDATSQNDLAQPFSLFGSIEFDLGRNVDDTTTKTHTLTLQSSFQDLHSSANFVDWSVLQYDSYEDVNGIAQERIEHSGNTVALYNSNSRIQYKNSLFNQVLEMTMSASYARGGVSSKERLRSPETVDFQEHWPQRNRYGYRGIDFAAEAGIQLLQNSSSSQPSSKDGDLIQNLILLLAADYTSDTISYSENRNLIPNLYKESTLNNLGLLAQLSSSFLDGRLGLIAGVRYDQHRGVELSAYQLDVLQGFGGQPALDALCDGRKCYDNTSYRGGITVKLFEGASINSVYMKALIGTAFKAPGAAFLYHSDYIGDLPTNPNPSLRPQEVRSLELLIGSVLFEHMVQTSLVFFQNEVDDKVSFGLRNGGVQASNGLPGRTLSALTIETWGLEGSFVLQLDPVTWRNSLSYQRSERSFGETSAQNIEDVFAYPNFTGYSSLAYAADMLHSQISLTLQYIGSRQGHWLNVGYDTAELAYRLPHYALLDLNIVSNPLTIIGDAPTTTLSLSVRNILNSQYELPGFNPYYGNDLPGKPRAIFFGVKQEL